VVPMKTTWEPVGLRPMGGEFAVQGDSPIGEVVPGSLLRGGNRNRPCTWVYESSGPFAPFAPNFRIVFGGLCNRIRIEAHVD